MAVNDSTTGGFLVPSTTPPADDLTLDGIFQTLLAALTGLAGNLVRPRWQPTVPKQPDPSVNWIAVGTLSVTSDDNPVMQHNAADDSGNGSDSLMRHEVVEMMASFYGPEGQQYAEMARDGLFLGQNNGTLAATYALVFTGEVDPLRSVPDLVNEQWRRRYDLTARFRRQIARTYPVRNLVAAELDLYTASGEAGAVVVPEP